MDINRKLAISYYKTIATINEPHGIFLVQHQETQKIFIKKVLDVYNIDIYKCLYDSPILGTPQIIDYYEEDGQLTIIEEFISGCSLQEKILSKKLSIEDIHSYMCDLCDVLGQLHSMNPAVVHRDIKPSNVIITNYNRAILLDFNAAKYFSPSSTEDTVLLGTQGYAAPEQYGFGSSTPQTDIYSLGIMLKEMVDSTNDGSFPKYNSIITKCTQIDPAERYKNIKDLKSALLSKFETIPNINTPTEQASFLPPGFRSKRPWKMLVASAYYIFICWLCLTLQVKNVSGLALWFERVFLLAMFLSIPVSYFNYRNIQKLMPICKSTNRFVHYLGITILDITIIFILFIILVIIETGFFNA
ncbi:MAG: serine/threonine protein kinase [Lachnospiraceae bacterium]|nr:serine/threonine protein kinase [Lachnospiraceae bacterium]